MQSLLAQRVRQCAHDVLLTDQFLERARTPLACERLS
jgi:hypothetical protein